MPNARPPRHRASKSNRFRIFLVRLLLLTKSQTWRRIVKLLRKTYERIISWLSSQVLPPPSQSRTRNTIDEPFASNLDSLETCCFPHPFPSAVGSSPLTIFPAQLPTMPPGLPQVEELSSSGSGTGSFATIYDVGSVDTIDSYRSSIQEVIPGAMPPRPISPLSPAIPWPNERVVTPDRPISPIPSASNRGPLPSDYTPAAHMRYPSATQDDDLSMPIPTTRRLLETPLLAIMAEIDCPRVFPIVPPNLPRYSRPINIPRRDMNKTYVKPPGKMKFDSGMSRGGQRGWLRCIHPEGARYYYDPHRRIYTEADFERKFEGLHISATIEKCISFLYTTYKSIIPDTKQCDLVLEYDPHRSESCYYYFAHHHTRSIFWVEEYDLQPELKRVQGEITPSHLDIAVERLYWLDLHGVHMSYFPHGHKFPTQLIGELKSKLVWSLTDELISPHPLSFFNTETLERLISVVDHIEESDDAVYALAIAGRLYNRFLVSHFMNYHGEVGARLDANRSVHGSPAPRVNVFMIVLFLLLFNNPARYLKNIHDIHTDGIVKEVTWRKHMEDFRNSWREYILYATVLLNANVALLATPAITPRNLSSSTVGEVASFLSIITSTGCVVVGLLLVRQHQIGTQRAAAEVLQQFLDQAGSAQRLAILYSVPYALLIWSVVSFTVAISFACFQGGGLVAIAIIAAAFLLVVLLAVWCAYSGVRATSLAKTLITRLRKSSGPTIPLPSLASATIPLPSLASPSIGTSVPQHVHLMQSSSGPDPAPSVFQANMHPPSLALPIPKIPSEVERSSPPQFLQTGRR